MEAGPGRGKRKAWGWVEVMAEHHPAKQEGHRKRTRSIREKGRWRGRCIEKVQQ